MNKSWLVIRSRNLPLSFRLDRRVPKTLLCLVSIALVAIAINVSRGDYPISLLEVVKTLLGADTGNRAHHFIVNDLRLPRTLVAFMVGAGLGISGAIFQGLTRNPLADPSILGINSCAGLAAVITIVFIPSAPNHALPLSAFGGALGGAILIYLLAGNKSSSPISLILVGVGISAVASAATTSIVTFGEIGSISQALVWLSGSVYGRGWEQVLSLLPWIVVFVPIALMLARHLNALNLGDDVARGLGSSVQWYSFLLLVVSVALAGAAVATAGTINFVGLIVPHLSRQLVGATHEGSIAVSGMMGGTLVVLADLLGRISFGQVEIPCGVMTAALGAPYFLYLLICNRKL